MDGDMTITIRMTADQRWMVKRAAIEAALTDSAWCRMVLLEKAKAVTAGLPSHREQANRLESKRTGMAIEDVKRAVGDPV